MQCAVKSSSTSWNLNEDQSIILHLRFLLFNEVSTASQLLHSLDGTAPILGPTSHVDSWIVVCLLVVIASMVVVVTAAAD